MQMAWIAKRPFPCTLYFSVWQDLAKFRHFDNILIVFGICYCLNCERIYQIFNAIGQISIFVIGQKLNKEVI